MSQGVRAGGLVVLSGQVAFDRDGQLVGDGDPEAQARQVFRNIAALVTMLGGGLADVVRLTCFAVSREAYAAYAGVKRELFTDRPPAATTVIVAGLVDPRCLLEVEAIAVVPE